MCLSAIPGRGDSGVDQIRVKFSTDKNLPNLQVQEMKQTPKGEIQRSHMQRYHNQTAEKQR